MDFVAKLLKDLQLLQKRRRDPLLQSWSKKCSLTPTVFGIDDYNCVVNNYDYQLHFYYCYNASNNKYIYNSIYQKQ